MTGLGWFVVVALLLILTLMVSILNVLSERIGRLAERVKRLENSDPLPPLRGENHMLRVLPGGGQSHGEPHGPGERNPH